jgi:hypothetical protein
MPTENDAEKSFILPSNNGLMTKGLIQVALADSEIDIKRVEIIDLGICWKLIFQNDDEYQKGVLGLLHDFP